MAGKAYLHRKCRQPACGRWSVFASAGAYGSACTFCGAAFGTLELGMDVIDTKAGDPVVTGRDAATAPAFPETDR